LKELLLMKNNEFEAFQQLWDLANEQSSNPKNLSSEAMSMIFDDFEDFELHTIEMALKHHRKNNRFAPTVADIMAIIDPAPSALHLSPDEAWLIAKKSLNQDKAVCTTPEIMQAYDIMYDVYDKRDENPARMAFREAYSRILRESASQRPRWFISQGNDKSLTAQVAEEAVRLGRLPAGSEAKYRIEAPTTTALEIIHEYQERIGISGEVRQEPKFNRKEDLAKIKQSLVEPKKPREKISLSDEDYAALPWYLREVQA